MIRNPWSPRFAWHRRPGGKSDGFGRVIFLDPTYPDVYFSTTPRREQFTTWLGEERAAILRATPLDGLTNQLTWRIAARLARRIEDWPVRTSLVKAMRGNISYLYGCLHMAIEDEERWARTEGREPDRRAWADEQGEVDTSEQALTALAHARDLPDDVPEEYRRTIAGIAFSTADELRHDIADRHGDSSAAQLARHAYAVGVLHDPDNWWECRRDVHDVVAMLRNRVRTIIPNPTKE